MKHAAITLTSSAVGFINWILDLDCWPTPVYNFLFAIHYRVGRTYLRLAHPLYFERLSQDVYNKGTIP
jgi:hypothetical protein